MGDEACVFHSISFFFTQPKYPHVITFLYAKPAAKNPKQRPPQAHHPMLALLLRYARVVRRRMTTYVVKYLLLRYGVIFIRVSYTE